MCANTETSTAVSSRMSVTTDIDMAVKKNCSAKLETNMAANLNASGTRVGNSIGMGYED